MRVGFQERKCDVCDEVVQHVVIEDKELEVKICTKCRLGTSQGVNWTPELAKFFQKTG